MKTISNETPDPQLIERVLSSLNGIADRFKDQSSDDEETVLHAINLISGDSCEGHKKLGYFYYRQSKFDLAIKHFEICINKGCADYTSFFYSANSLKNMGDFESAVNHFLKSLELNSYPEGLVNLAATYSDLKNDVLALQTLESLTTKFPSFTLGHYNLGIYWYDRRDIKKSIASYNRALATNPEHGDSKVALSLALLMSKNYIDGFVMHDSRWGVSPNCPIRDFIRPYWHGQEVDKRSSVLVTVEQGFGDTLQMIRYLPMLAERFSRVCIEVQPQMKRLISQAFPTVEVVVNKEPLPSTDYYCPVMSLPRAFGTTYEAIPGQQKYISIPHAEPLDPALISNPKKKVGICWRGGALNPKMLHRSLTFKQIERLFDNESYVWVSLMKDVTSEEREAMLEHRNVKDYNNQIADFYDTCRLIDTLDAVVTVDTAVAHLAGAMGKPTIIILNEGYDWRWHIDDDISAWYPTAKLLRSYKLPGNDSLVPEILNYLSDTTD